MDYAKPPHEREPVTTIAWRLAHHHYSGTAEGARLLPTTAGELESEINAAPCV
jgi:hypothetical protein